MYWQDEGYLLSKKNFNENSIIIEVFSLEHGKCSGIIYGGLSRKKRRFFQIGNNLLLNYKTRAENKIGYFNIELIKPVSPIFFDDKKKTICILSACTILKILLPESQINRKIYHSFEKMMNDLNCDNWIRLYIDWERYLIKELGFEDDLKVYNNADVKKSLSFNRNLLMENFIIPNRLKFPLFRNILENYFN